MRFEAAIKKFFFEPASTEPLAILRVLLSTMLLVQAAMIAPDFLELYGGEGILQASVVPGFREQWLPVLLKPSSVIGAGVLYVAGLCFLLAGVRVRIAAVVAWLFHFWLTGGHFTTYGVDSFAHIGLFYLVVFPSTGGKSDMARLGLRVLQLHMCIAYFSSGVEKSLGEQWQNGEVIWKALNLPIYAQMDFNWIKDFPLLTLIAAWGTLVVEIGYPFFVWPKATRSLWVALTVSLHVGIAIFLGLTTFSLVMAILTLSAFGYPQVTALKNKLLGLFHVVVNMDRRDSPQAI